jgi:hypothetical protein
VLVYKSYSVGISVAHQKYSALAKAINYVIPKASVDCIIATHSLVSFIVNFLMNKSFQAKFPDIPQVADNAHLQCGLTTGGLSSTELMKMYT